ncbi:Testis-specific serine/threonine-protein kinase 2 [Halotydeus destructor]|nr:Testis-specific serine/threonine-protein kinase 2 [Halotydeus destructor]
MPKPKEKIKLDDKTAAVFTKKGYEVTNKISEGAFGQVYKAQKTADGQLAAVKVMQISKIPKIVAEKFLPREFDTSTTIHHKYVLEVFDIFKSNACYYIFMEFAPNGSLMTYCKKGPIAEKKSRFWFKQCAEGLDCMHVKYKICHRDIKPENILLDSHDNCKLSDFGFAKVMDSEDALTGTICGTMPFYSPELLKPKNGKYNPFACDIWAMGVTLFMMINSDWPFKFPNGTSDKDGCKSMYKQQMSKGFKHNPKINHSDQLEDIIDKMLEPDVDERLTSQQMLKHNWLRKSSA